MQDHAIAAQIEQPLDRLPFVFRTVTPLGHQQLLAVGFGFGLHKVHQCAEETAAIGGSDQSQGVAVAGGQRTGGRVGRVAKLGHRLFNLLAGLPLNVGIAIHYA
ncbi:hypothetical protein D3C75_1248820 [compost metagenome]